MFRIPEQTVHRFDAAMAAAEVELTERPDYRKWLRFNRDFCDKYRRSAAASSPGPFPVKVASKYQSEAHRCTILFGTRPSLGFCSASNTKQNEQNCVVYDAFIKNNGKRFRWQAAIDVCIFTHTNGANAKRLLGCCRMIGLRLVHCYRANIIPQGERNPKETSDNGGAV